MEKFTASNGATVQEIETMTDGARLVVWASHPERAGSTTAYLIDAQRDALREFFLAERDAELGRWRWPESPDFVVYQDALGLLVMWEGMGGSTRFHPDALPDAPSGGRPAAAARAYIEAHTPSRPWEDAQPGEVWALRLVNAENEVAYTLGNDRLWYRAQGVMIGELDAITDGHRIWPEVSE